MYDSRTLLVCASIFKDGDFDEILKLLESKQDFMSNELLEKAQSMKSKFVTILDPDYPESLKRVYKPPIVLYYYGDLSLANNLDTNVSVVGTREPSSTAIMNTILISKYLVSNGYSVVSGLAYGVDFHAQNTAMLNNGKVIAVLGGGIDNLYPKTHYKLYEEIKRKGLVISEYPMNSVPSKNRFPYRNRLICALSNKIIIPEAKRVSGTSTTVAWATNDLQKDILCVPAPFGEDSLCNVLIREGAGLIGSITDLEDELPNKKS